jgi:serine/threonine protein kinase
MPAGNHGVELAEGEEFAGYRIEQRLGRGGMGVLYLAHEPGLERRVALKLIAPEAAADEVFALRFAEESKIAASIEHPNVVPIYAAGKEAGVPYIAMRYVAGADLAKRLAREGRLEPGVAVEIVAQVGNGLDAIHAAGLVHRDVKPANVLLSGDEAAHAYITDFGVARNVSTESGLTQTGRFVGTLDYVAPEQISGGEIDARVDVYALGCLLFKLLTGEVPFPRDGEAARLYAHLNDPPPAPSLYVPECSMTLDDVVIRAMSKSPEDRYPSAGDLGRAAQAALRGEQPALPERTVATGMAATRTAETFAGEPAESPAPTRRAVSSQSTAATQAIPPRRRGWTLGILVATLVVVAGVVIAIAAAGGGSEPNTTASGTTGEVSRPRKSKPAEKPLTRSELIAKTDSICSDSQATFLATSQSYPEGEATPDVTYSKILVGISMRAVRRLRTLEPPASVSKPFGEYLEAQARVKRYDREALEAAEAGDTAGYLAARERRNNEAAERYDLAREIDLQQCSAGRN